MAITVQNHDLSVLAALAASLNDLRAKITLNAGSLTSQFHADITSTTAGDFQVGYTATNVVPTAPTAVDLPTTITLAENVRSVLLAHFPDALAHKAADATNLALVTYAVLPQISNTTGTLAQVEALLNAIQTAYNAHRTQTGVHYNNDTTNVSSAAAATSLSTAETLAGDLKTQLTAHIPGAALGNLAINIVAP